MSLSHRFPRDDARSLSRFARSFVHSSALPPFLSHWRKLVAFLDNVSNVSTSNQPSLSDGRFEARDKIVPS